MKYRAFIKSIHYVEFDNDGSIEPQYDALLRHGKEYHKKSAECPLVVSCIEEIYPITADGEKYEIKVIQ